MKTAESDPRNNPIRLSNIGKATCLACGAPLYGDTLSHTPLMLCGCRVGVHPNTREGWNDKHANLANLYMD